jgi:DNA-binding CsgD family transcriptional regulator
MPINNHNIVKIMHLNDDLLNLPKLSPREKECLEWVAKGLSDTDIGDLLSISSSTVTSYIKNVRDKFKVRTRIQAVTIAISCGIILP